MIKTNKIEINMNFSERLGSYKGIEDKDVVLGAIHKGMALFYKTIEATTGGSGTSLLKNGEHTSDGLNILQNMPIAEYDELNNSIKEQLIKITEKIAKQAGDGTSTVIVLLALLYFSAEKYTLAETYNKVHLDNAFKFVTKLLFDEIKNQAVDVDDNIIKDALIIAANNDVKFGETVFNVLHNNVNKGFQFKIETIEDSKLAFDDFDLSYEKYNGLEIPLNSKGIEIYKSLYKNYTFNKLSKNYSILDSNIVKYNFGENDIALNLVGDGYSMDHFLFLFNLAEHFKKNIKVIIYDRAMNPAIAKALMKKNVIFNDCAVSGTNVNAVSMLRDSSGAYPMTSDAIEQLTGTKFDNTTGKLQRVEGENEYNEEFLNYYGVFDNVIIHNDGKMFLSPLLLDTPKPNEDIAHRINTLTKQNTDAIDRREEMMNNKELPEAARNQAKREFYTLTNLYNSLYSDKMKLTLRVGSGANVTKYNDLLDDTVRVFKSLLSTKKVVNGALFTSYSAIFNVKTAPDGETRYLAAKAEYPMFNSLSDKALTSLINKIIGCIEVGFSNFIYDILEKYDYHFDRTSIKSLNELLSRDGNPFAPGGKLCINLLSKTKSSVEKPIVIPVPLSNELMVLDSIFTTLTSFLGISSSQLSSEVNGRLVIMEGKDPREFVTNLGLSIFKCSRKPNVFIKSKNKDNKFKSYGLVKNTKSTGISKTIPKKLMRVGRIR